jgi:hypothetical protein
MKFSGAPKRNWYSEYDSRSFPLLANQKFFIQLSNVAQSFRGCEGPKAAD